MDEFFTELDFLKHEPLITSLNCVVEKINYNRSTVDARQYKPYITKEHALQSCSKESLEELETVVGDRIHAIYDCSILKFDNYNLDGLHAIVGTYVSTVLKNITGMGISGRTWYPPEFGYMGWHTNSNNQCYRLYCSFCRESDKSFFRYRNPTTKEIHTAWDKAGWNFRLFKITNPPLWHCVYSETDRFSIGYSIFAD